MTPDSDHIQNTTPPEVVADFATVSSSLPRSLHGSILELAAEIASISTDAAAAFIKTCPFAFGRVGGPGITSWARAGLDILDKSEPGGIAYFRLEMGRSVQLLDALSPGVSLDSIRPLLETYCLALSGRRTTIISPRESAGASPADCTMYLASFVSRYTTKPDNFAWYKVAATHQIAHVEFASHHIEAGGVAELGQELGISPRSPIRHNDRPGLAAFLERFESPRLALDIFTMVEDARIDGLIKRHYRGIASAVGRTQDEALEARPPLSPSRHRDALLEILARLSLGRPGRWPVPASLLPRLHLAARIMNEVLAEGGYTASDSAAATMRLYRLFGGLPTGDVPAGPWDTFDTGQIPPEILNLSLEDVTRMLKDLPGGIDTSPHDSPATVAYRGTHQPEATPETPTANSGTENAEGPSDSAEQPADGASEEDDKTSILTVAFEGETRTEDAQVFGAATANLEETAMASGRKEVIPADTDEEGALEKDGPLSFLYDEWDYRSGDYRLDWCRVRQVPLDEGSPDFFEEVLEEHEQLAKRLGRRFEELNPENSHKVKRLPDGEDYDLDAVVDAVIARKAGSSIDPRVYWRRNKAEREVSVAFLLDMSSSTVEYINRIQGVPLQMVSVTEHRDYSDWLKANPDTRIRPMEFKRIIDLEKESTVLLIRALEMVGDSYAIYGFSGHGRTNVEFYPIKDFGEPLSDRVKGRIDTITPMQGTRMGPAIRHTVSRLKLCNTKSRILFLISDGRPEDHGYGKHGLQRDYAAQDTRMALLEAKRSGITPFCLTVDRAGHDYLGAICEDMSYEVVCDIESLPLCLPTLYSKLTA